MSRAVLFLVCMGTITTVVTLACVGAVVARVGATVITAAVHRVVAWQTERRHRAADVATARQLAADLAAYDRELWPS